MAYKVLNSVLVKDAANLASLSTDMLVLVINKNTKNDSSFKELNKKSKNYISKTVQSHLDESGSIVLLPKVDGINAKNILLVKGLDTDTPTHKWLSYSKVLLIKEIKVNAKIYLLCLEQLHPRIKMSFG